MSKKRGLTLVELLVTAVTMCVLIIPAVDMMSSMFVSQVDYKNSVQAKQDNLNLIERIAAGIREGVYVYPEYTYIRIPADGHFYGAYASVGYNAIAVLIPKFDSNGNLLHPTADTTSFTGMAYSIINEYFWTGKYNGKYVLVETTYDMDLPTDANDPLVLLSNPPTDWSEGSTYLLADNFLPAPFTTMGNKAFKINNNRTRIDYAFIPDGDVVRFPGYYGASTVNDVPYITSIGVRNWRKTSF